MVEETLVPTNPFDKAFEEIRIRNQGPIYSLNLHVPRRGGVMVMYGPNGCGKSSALEAIGQLVSRQGTLVARDGTTGVEVTGFGVRVALGRKISRSRGELEVKTLEGFSIADLVEPNVRDDLEARDAKRIKALLRLAGAEAKVELFYPVVGSQEEFDKYVPSTVLATEDLVAMQGSIKRAFEKASRTAKEQADIDFAAAEAARLSTTTIDITQPDDSELLSAAFEDATRTEARLKAEKKAREEADRGKEQAQAAFERVKTVYQGPTLEGAENAEETAFATYADTNTKVQELEALLDEAKLKRTQAEHEKKLAEQTRQSAANHFISVKAFQETIDAELPQIVTEDQLTRAAEALKSTKEAVENGALVRKAKEDLERVFRLKTKALEAQSKSEELRTAAQTSEMVLSAAVESLGIPLKVHGNRLVATNTDRPNEVFDDLSDGEQWRLAADIVVKTVGPGGVIILPQRAWQDLDQDNKRILAEGVEAKDPNELGVIVITAQADSNYHGITPKMFEPFPLVE